jgi:hypothetical protein
LPYVVKKALAFVKPGPIKITLYIRNNKGIIIYWKAQQYNVIKERAR